MNDQQNESSESLKRSRDMDTKQSFMNLLQSMGVHEYDPAVITALEEYGRRVATDLLCDAKDYATHASRQELDVEDVKLAIKLRDSKRAALTTRATAELDAEINSKDLPLFPEDGVTINPANLPLLQTRPYTYVPGHVAYPESATSTEQAQFSDSPNNNGNQNRDKKNAISIILHPEKRGETNAGNQKNTLV